ncbi:MAG: DUF2207 domain-containing protein [Lapillicoccus sp.]
MSRTGGAVQESRTRARRIGALYAVLAALALMVALPATAWASRPAGAVAVTAAASAVPQAPAAADADSMTSFDDKIVLDKDGGATFTETIAYSFGPGTHHGIYRNVVVRQVANADDPNTYRYYSLSDVAVTSPTGASTGVKLIDQGSTTQIRIGDANTTVDGPQTYVVRYHLANIMNPFTDHAELFYNIFLDDQIPKDVVTLSVSGPGGVTEAACYRGDTGSKESCGTAQPGNPATFQATNIQPGENLTIATKLPRGGFGALAPDLRSGTSSVDASQAKALTALALGGGVLVPVVAAGLMATLVATRGRDEWYAGLTPGLTPGSVPGSIPGSSDGALASAPTVRGKTPTIAVQFTPPPGVQPGMVGTIVDESVDTVDVSATVIDLAVRGYLRIEETKTGGMFSRTDWSLTRLNPDPNQPPLRPYESTILEGIFATANPIQLSDLKYKFNTVLAAAKSEMYDEVVQRGWFRKSPQSQRGAWQALGFLLIGGGIASLFFLTAPTHDIDRTGGWGIGIPSGVVLGLGLVVGGLIFRILGKRMAAKTAEGSAMNAQALGFKKYLVTAEAGQIKFEEAQSIFSRYLPYAIVFGVADHWASTFQQVAEAAAASGQSLAMPSWYLYNGALFPNFTGIADGVGSFATSAGGTFAASASSGGSGGSGFGGGGFSGGGGGGSSSGSW